MEGVAGARQACPLPSPPRASCWGVSGLSPLCCTRGTAPAPHDGPLLPFSRCARRRPPCCFHRLGGCSLHILRWKCLSAGPTATPPGFPARRCALQMGPTCAAMRRPGMRWAASLGVVAVEGSAAWAHGRPSLPPARTPWGRPPRRGRVSAAATCGRWRWDSRKWWGGGGVGQGHPAGPHLAAGWSLSVASLWPNKVRLGLPAPGSQAER